MSPDVALALSYVPARNRRSVEALFDIDAAMGDAVRTTSEPALGAIKLAWWREQLEGLDLGAAPAEPRLQAIAEHVLVVGITGADVAELEQGWLSLFEPFPWNDLVIAAVARRGDRLFALAATILQRQGSAPGGDLWALVDVARHCSDPASRQRLLRRARDAAGRLPRRSLPAQRPLTALAVAALRDLAGGETFEPQGTPARAWAMLKHRLSGRL